MTVILPAAVTVTGQEERTELTVTRRAIMPEFRTPTLAAYSFIPDSDEGFTEWLAIMAELADPRLYIHHGHDGIGFAIKAVPVGENELHEFPLEIHGSEEEIIALAALAFPDKKPDRVYRNCPLRRVTAVNAPESRSERF